MHKPERHSTDGWTSVALMVQEHTEEDKRALVIYKEGDSALVVFRGEPYAFEAVWDETNGWVRFCQDNSLHKSVIPGLRIRINVVVIAENNKTVAPRAAYWEMGPQSFKKLCKVREISGLDWWTVQILRLDNDDAEPGYSLTKGYTMPEKHKEDYASLPLVSLTHDVDED